MSKRISITRLNSYASKLKISFNKMYIAFKSRIKSITIKTLHLIKILPRNIIGIFFDNVYGVWIVKHWASFLGYILFFTLCIVIIFISDHFDYSRQFIHSSNSNEAVIGTMTILLALLIPVAIALIEDGRGSTLARQTIVKSVIRFGFAPLVLLIVCIFLFIPTGIHLYGVSITLKNSYAALLACCILFILASFYRAYKWLSDDASYSAGKPETPQDNEPQADAFFSYRFAQIVSLLAGAKGYETWMTIWSQWFPPEYEGVLHASFFRREFGVLRGKKIKRYIILSLELEAYDKHFKMRNINSWRFELEYAKQFLLLYAEIMQVISANRTNARMAGLWRGESASERINNKVVEVMMTHERAWNLFDFMEEYVERRSLLNKKNDKHLQNDKLVDSFLEKYFEEVAQGKLSTYSLESYFSPEKAWAVTYDNLYKKHYNLTFIVVNEFKEWLFKKLDNKTSNDSFFEVDTLINDLFPQADPITMGTLYWILYQAKNTIESNIIVELVYKEQRPFGHIGRSTGFWADEEDVRSKNFVAFQKEQEDNAIQLFATMYASYFRNFWNLDEIIKSAKLIDSSDFDEYEKNRLESFIRVMQKVKKFYKVIDTKTGRKKPH